VGMVLGAQGAGSGAGDRVLQAVVASFFFTFNDAVLDHEVIHLLDGIFDNG
jgi:hypothetical protein